MKQNTLMKFALFILFIITMIGCSQSAQTPKVKEVDALTFLTAFHDGKADQYKGYIVKGEGWEFSNYMFGMAPQGPIDLTIGFIGPDNKVTILKGWKEWSEAESAAQPMLMVELAGNGFMRKEFTPDDMPVYTFTGRYTGETTSKIRLVFKSGTQPLPYLVPVLTEGEVK
jgi:hypothetical protein